MTKPYTTLAIETSCDETGVAIIESTGLFSHHIAVNLLASQIAIHKKYGGVVPGLAAREHVKNLPLLVKKALKAYGNISFDAIAFTDTPGLEPALLVGRMFAKTLSYAWKIPCYPVNHLYGHLFANFATPKNSPPDIFPAIGLVISGGHTQLYTLSSFSQIELLGETLDDAVGEALDKGARLLGLEYPGGPKIELLARKGKKSGIVFPIPMAKSGDLRLSFAGLKTSLLYKLRDLKASGKKITAQEKADIALAYQSAAFTSLVEKTKYAITLHGARTLLVGGGVAANQTLAGQLRDMISLHFPETSLCIPEKALCTDNAVMIGLAHILPWMQNHLR